MRDAIAELDGVSHVDVLLGAQKALVTFDPARVKREQIVRSLEIAGYPVAQADEGRTAPGEIRPTPREGRLGQGSVGLLGGLFATVLLLMVLGEWTGVLASLNDRVPLGLGVLLVLVAGYGVFQEVVKAALHRRVISHTVMSLGVVAAIAVGQWITALLLVFFMRVGEWVEEFTAERARQAVKELTRLSPVTARVLRNGQEIEVPVAEVVVGETVVVRPGESIPVDGEVLDGSATVDASSVTGESLPVEVSVGTDVFAATIALLGSLRVRADRVGADTTFGRVIRLVEESEANRADVQRLADRFSAWYLPVVLTVGALTLVLRRDPLAVAAVFVVACSCAFAMATPIAVLASIGAAARHGLLIKGGKVLEALAQADVLLLDKTGTLTTGRPEITRVVSLDGVDSRDLLYLAATVERYSEHPLASAVLAAAEREAVVCGEPRDFSAVPGRGVKATVGDRLVLVGTRAFVAPESAETAAPADPQAEEDGFAKSRLYVSVDGTVVGLLEAADTLRAEVPRALEQLRMLGLTTMELLSGDNEATTRRMAEALGVNYRAGLLPEEKIARVREYQEQGRHVVMVGDGVNDAPALAQADVGIAMGAAGSDVALEAAHAALLREDWSLVPQLVRISRRTMGVIRLNIGFTLVYNVVGLSLAAFGLLPPVWAAAAQTLPDIGMLGNSSRLLRIPAADEPPV